MARAVGRARDRKSGVRAHRERGGERTLWIGSAMAVEKRENDETRAFEWVKLYEKRAQTWLRKADTARLPGNPAERKEGARNVLQKVLGRSPGALQRPRATSTRLADHFDYHWPPRAIDRKNPA